MNKLKLLLRTQFLHILPFFIFVLVYFIYANEIRSDVWTTIFKCAPILYLMLYVINQRPIYKYSQRILLGLICSCIGDILLNMDYFIKGMAAFALAQIFYIWAFGWRPLSLPIGIALYIAGAAVVFCLVKEINDVVLVFGVPIYTGLLLTMCWRSLARGAHTKDSLHIFCAMGCVLFVVSDSLIGVEMFLNKFPYSRICIMWSYYAAQFAITMGTVNDDKCRLEKPPKHQNNIKTK